MIEEKGINKYFLVWGYILPYRKESIFYAFMEIILSKDDKQNTLHPTHYSYIMILIIFPLSTKCMF